MDIVQKLSKEFEFIFINFEPCTDQNYYFSEKVDENLLNFVRNWFGTELQLFADKTIIDKIYVRENENFGNRLQTWLDTVKISVEKNGRNILQTSSELFSGINSQIYIKINNTTNFKSFVNILVKVTSELNIAYLNGDLELIRNPKKIFNTYLGLICLEGEVLTSNNTKKIEEK